MIAFEITPNKKSREHSFPGFFIDFAKLISDLLINNNIRNESQYYKYYRSTQNGVVIYITCK
jgi:hypothetical protein